MKLKCRPDDFRVREVLRWEKTPGGAYGVYLLSKTKLSTFEALQRVARAAGVSLRNVGYAGLKDRQSTSEQLISIPGAMRRIVVEGLAVRFLGRSDQPIRRTALVGNDFDLVLRDLTASDVPLIVSRAAALAREGLPNYFDNQRFECMLSRRRFVGQALVEGRWEEALRWFLAGEPGRHGQRHETAEYLARHWGEWERCVARFSRRRSVAPLRHLAQFPEDFAGAFAFVNPDLLRLHLYAFQSYIWNTAVAFLIEQLVPGEQLLRLPYVAGTHVCPAAPDTTVQARLEQMFLPLPDDRTEPMDATARKALQKAFSEVGLDQRAFQIRWPGPPDGYSGPRPNWEYREEPRPVLLHVERLHAGAPFRDALHPQRLALRVRFRLPAGAYATLVLKRLAEDASLFDAPARRRAPSRDRRAKP